MANGISRCSDLGGHVPQAIKGITGADVIVAVIAVTAVVFVVLSHLNALSSFGQTVNATVLPAGYTMSAIGMIYLAARVHRSYHAGDHAQLVMNPVADRRVENVQEAIGRACDTLKANESLRQEAKNAALQAMFSVSEIADWDEFSDITPLIFGKAPDSKYPRQLTLDPDERADWNQSYDSQELVFGETAKSRAAAKSDEQQSYIAFINAKRAAFQPANQHIPVLAAILRQRLFPALVEKMKGITREQWSDKEFLELANRCMLFAFVISWLTLDDLKQNQQTYSQLQGNDPKFLAKDQGIYAVHTLYWCPNIYHALRAGMQTTNTRTEKFDAWRNLYHAYGEYLNIQFSKDQQDSRLVEWTATDLGPESFSSRHVTSVPSINLPGFGYLLIPTNTN